jgi:CrcB protein
VVTWVAIAVGGALGSVARHAINRLIHEQWLTMRFPAATVLVNLTGCFAIGVLAGMIAAGRLTLRAHWREFVFVGVLGGYTTFSTFGLDTFLLARTHSVGHAAVNVAGQVAGCLIAVWVGYQLGSGRP